MATPSPAAEVHMEARGLFLTLAATAGLILWYAASNAKDVPGPLSLLLLALGCALYLFPGRLFFAWVYRDVTGIRFPCRSTGARWENIPDAIALTAIAAWINTHPGLFPRTMTVLVIAILYVELYR